MLLDAALRCGQFLLSQFTKIIYPTAPHVHNPHSLIFSLLITGCISLSTPQQYSGFCNTQVLHRNPHISPSVLQHLVLTIFIILYRLWVIGFIQFFLPVLFSCFFSVCFQFFMACEFLIQRPQYSFQKTLKECLAEMGLGTSMILYWLCFYYP